MTPSLPDTPALQSLKGEFSSLADRAKALDLQNPAPLMELALEFETWTAQAKALCGPWAATLAGQARQLVKGLQAGRPAVQGLERLLQGLLEASHQLQLPQGVAAAGPVPREGAEVFLFEAGEATAPGTPDPAESFLTVKAEDREMFQEFLGEVPDHLGAVESNLLNLSRRGSWDVMKVYRPFHTLKGLFGYLGMPAMSEAAHQAETLLEPYKNGQGRPTEAQQEALLRTLDLFRRQVRLISEGLPLGRIGLCPVPGPGKLSPAVPSTLSSNPSVPAPSPAPAENPGGEESQDQFLRVNVARMDGLLEALEEMIVGQTRLGEIAQQAGISREIREVVQRLGKQSRNLQDKVLSLRMVPVEPLFKRLSRVVRDLSQRTGKSVQLRLEGSGTELDKRLVDELWEPAVHLVRNALDHGLESPAERKAAGKSSHGSLWIKAAHSGGDFVLEVADDGRGLNLSKIAEKAGLLGWLPPFGSPDPYWLEDLIFRPGFSTADLVTDVSGRGVGLDVVKRRIQDLKGLIRLESGEGKGCRFILRIPLTLALMEGVLLRAGRGLYLLPLTQVGRFWNMSNIPLSESDSIPGQEPEGDLDAGASPEKLPLRRIDLAETFGETGSRGRQPVGILVGTDENRAFLLADEIIGKKQVVLRGLSGIMEGFPSVSGAALLPDGKVSLVLDIPSLLRVSVPAATGAMP